ncbi:hypothetical protein NPIL_49201 [Nephila pilipes]|uniref:Uncharacterized protein n=1 Tax=Nephila pilipes TaxID=299642 RepID=A0A8X6I9G5_NEPPI|nr:hypothetical protein NPIL_49201 [Nephila pilipes]
MSSTDGAAADIPRCYTVGRERDALRFASRQLQLTFSSREGDACDVRESQYIANEDLKYKIHGIIQV